MDYETFVKNNTKGIDFDSLRNLINKYLNTNIEVPNDFYNCAQTFGVETNKDFNDVSKADSSSLNKDYLLTIYEKYVDFLFSNIKLFAEHAEKNEFFKHLCDDYEIIRNNDTLRNPTSIKMVFKESNFEKLFYKPVYKQDNHLDSRFTFINYDLESIIGKNYEDIGVRIYLSPNFEYITEIIKKIREYLKEEHSQCLIKFSESEKYNDRIILYVSKDSFEVVLNIVNSVVKCHPEYFSGKIKNPLWGSINGYDNIYFGEEPEDREKSFGSVRSEAIKSALNETLHESRLKKQLSDEEFEKFKSNLKIACLVYNINPDNFALNISDKTKFEIGNKNIFIAIDPYNIDYDNKKFAVFSYEVPDNVGEKEPYIFSFSSMFYSEKALNTDNTRIYIDEEELRKLYNDNQEVKNSIIKRIEEQKEKYNQECENTNRNMVIEQLSSYINNPYKLGRYVEMLYQKPFFDDRKTEKEFRAIESKISRLISEYCHILLLELLLNMNFEKDILYQQLYDKCKALKKYYDEFAPEMAPNLKSILSFPTEFINDTAYLCNKYNVSYDDLKLKRDVGGKKL